MKLKNKYFINHYKLVITGIIFTIILGTLCHFLYEWSGNNLIIGFFCANSESTFEHMKLLFTPFLIYTFIEHFLLGNHARNYYISKAIGVILGLISIPLFFYGYTAFTKTNYLPVDIAIFVLSVLISYVTAAFIQEKHSYNKYESIGLPILLLLTLIMVIVSFIKLS